MIRLRALLAGCVVLVIAMIGATPALAADATGPVYPAPGGNTFSSTSAGSGEIGKAGGVTWTLGGFDNTSYTQLAWGPAADDEVKYAFDGAYDSPGETLSYDPACSNLAGGIACFSGSASFVDDLLGPVTYPTRFTLTVTDTGGSPLALTRSTTLPQPAFNATIPAGSGDIGAVLPVTGGFKAHLLFEAFNGAWVPATDLFNTHNTSGPGTAASFLGGFFYTSVPPDIDISPTSLVFGSVAVGSTSGPQTFTLTNTGPAGSQLHIGSPSFSGAHPGDFAIDLGSTTCSGAPLASGASCVVGFTFSPTGGGGRTATFVVPSDDPDEPTVNVGLSGTGLTSDLVLSPSPLAFGTILVGNSASLPLTLTNTGSAPLLLVGPGLTKSGPAAAEYDVLPGTCSFPLAPAASCQATVVFAPTGTGPRLATLTFTDNTPSGSHSVNLTGDGITALSDLAIAIGASTPTVRVGRTLAYTVTVSNAGPTAASGVTVVDTLPTNTTFVSVAGAGFTCTAPPVDSTGTVSCTSPSLAAGASATITLVVKVANGGRSSMTNTASVSATTPDPSTVNNSASITTSIYGKR